MDDNLKPFLMVINDETGDFVDIEMIQAVFRHTSQESHLALTSGTIISSPLKPREIWSRINVIRHKYGQQRRFNTPSSSAPFEKSYAPSQVDRGYSIPPERK